MPNLFQLDSEFLQIESVIELSDGELTPELEKRYNEVLDSIIVKEENYIAVSKTFDMNIDAGKDLIKRLQAKVKAMENRQERLKQRLIDHMIITGKESFKTELGKVILTSNKKVKDLPESEYPEQYLETIITRKLDKKALKKDAEINPELEKFIEETKSIRIY